MLVKQVANEVDPPRLYIYIYSVSCKTIHKPHKLILVAE